MPRSDDWEFEIKWDGYRIVSRVAGGEAELRTRKDQDYTERFANVAKELAKALKTPDCVVDGEVCALDEEGRPSFSAMQQRKPGTPIVYYLFDLLEVDGEPVIDLPLSERRARLERAARQAQPHRPVLRVVRRRAGAAGGGQGAASSRASWPSASESRYLPGKRSRDWLKFKAHAEQEFVIAGYTRGKGRRSGGFGSLVLGGLRGRGARVRRQRRHRLRRRGDRAAAEAAAAAGAQGRAVRAGPEAAARAQGRHRLGRAEARRRGRRSSNGRTTAACAPPSTRASARTRARTRCGASFQASSRRRRSPR